MHPTKTLRVLLVLSGLMAVVIGASILVSPAAFHAGYGTELGSDANLLSEIRAPGGALLVLGILMGIGAFVPRMTHASTVIAAAVYLAYGVSRVVSIVLDGMPVDALLGATAIEFVVGIACLIALTRSPRVGSEA